MGLDFLRAAREIDGWTGRRRPEFMRESMRWFVEFYANGAHRLPQIAPATDSAPAAERPVIQAAEAPGGPRADTDDRARAAAASISVVIPVFNHVSYLRRCVLSAHRQTLAPRGSSASMTGPPISRSGPHSRRWQRKSPSSGCTSRSGTLGSPTRRIEPLRSRRANSSRSSTVTTSLLPAPSRKSRARSHGIPRSTISSPIAARWTRRIGWCGTRCTGGTQSPTRWIGRPTTRTCSTP